MSSYGQVGGIMGIGTGGVWLNTSMDRVMERALDVAALREQLLVNNIANVETPGFKRSDVDFNAALHQALSQTSGELDIRRTRAGHFTGLQNGYSVAPTPKEWWYRQKNDESNVSLETENASRDQNQILYSAAAQLYSDRLQWLGIVLDSRR